jgi:hypothetical protein
MLKPNDDAAPALCFGHLRHAPHRLDQIVVEGLIGVNGGAGGIGRLIALHHVLGHDHLHLCDCAHGKDAGGDGKYH